MAFKRAVQSCIIKMMPKFDGPSYLAFKAKPGEYMKKMFALPVEPPKIDWSAYKDKIPVPGLVDYLKKSYQVFKAMPHPKDDVHSADVDGREKKITEEIQLWKVKYGIKARHREPRHYEIPHGLPFTMITSEDVAHVKPKSTVDLEKGPSVGHSADIGGREKEIAEEIEQLKVKYGVKARHREPRHYQIPHRLPFTVITPQDAALVKPKSIVDLVKTPSVGPHEDDIILDKPKEEKDECDGQKKVHTAPTVPNLK